MPILELDLKADTLQQLCSGCGRTLEVDLQQLQLGVEVAGTVVPHSILLPPCPDCGARDQLMLTSDTCPDALVDSPMDLQRRAVNTLAAHLDGKGRTLPAAADAHRQFKGRRDVLPKGKQRHQQLHPVPGPPLDPAKRPQGFTAAFLALQPQLEAEHAAAQAKAREDLAAARQPLLDKIKAANAASGTAAAKLHAARVVDVLAAGNFLLAAAEVSAAKAAADLAGTQEARDAAAAAQAALDAARGLP